MINTVEVDDTAEDTTDWLTADQAAKRLRMSRRTFERSYVQSGLITRYKCNDRVFRFKPEDLANVEIDDQVEDNPALLDTPAAALLAQAYSHNEMLMRQVHAQNVHLLNIMREENAALRSRCKDLEENHLSMVRAQQAALNEQADRELAAATVAAEEKRKDDALNVIKELGGKALESHKARQMAQAGAAFFDEVTDEQIAMLDMMGDSFLTPKQQQILERLKNSRQGKQQTEQTEEKT